MTDAAYSGNGRAAARFRDLAAALTPIILFTAAAVLIFLIRQIYGPSAARNGLWVAAGLTVMLGLVFLLWPSWRERLAAAGAPGGIRRAVISIGAILAIVACSYGLPYWVIRDVIAVPSPFTTMQWLLAVSILVQGLAWRYVLSARAVPAWMGALFWMMAAAAGAGCWKAALSLFG